MFNRLPVEVNPFRLIEQRKSLVGTIPLARLPRIQELLCSDKDESAEIKVKLDFNRSERGLPLITGEIDTQLDLSCQRCLSKLEYAITADIHVILVITDEQAERVQEEGYESYLVEEERLFLQDFIEDEVLLALPLSTMHEECDAGRPYIEALPEDEIDLVEEDDDGEENPFAALKNLKDLE